jgi:hypothetical protein
MYSTRLYLVHEYKHQLKKQQQLDSNLRTHIHHMKCKHKGTRLFTVAAVPAPKTVLASATVLSRYFSAALYIDNDVHS